MTILLTGATGFIGSHIAKSLIKEGHTVYATCRNRSNYSKCNDFINKIRWLNQDKKDWEKELDNVQLDILIHAAWTGITSSERNDWFLQLTNFEYSKLVIDLSIRSGVKKIICLGSQAEYGLYNYKVTEEHTPMPTDSYGAVKLLTLYYLQNTANKHFIHWYWIRIFSIIGENENKSWLLSQVMEKLLNEDQIELTEGLQKYDYLYIDDFIIALNRIVECFTNKSGIYNICSSQPIEIRQLLLLLAKKLNSPISSLKFGAIPYRLNQNMYMAGSSKKYERTFGRLELHSLNIVINNITKHYKENQK